MTNLHLLQNRYTPNSIAISPCNAKAWRIVRRDNPTLKVHLRVESTGKRDILLQPDAPVSSIIYQCPKLQVRIFAYNFFFFLFFTDFFFLL